METETGTGTGAGTSFHTDRPKDKDRQVHGDRLHAEAERKLMGAVSRSVEAERAKSRRTERRRRADAGR